MSQAIRVEDESPDEQVVEFFFAPGSRYCYLAASQMPALEEETGCRVDWRPVDGREIRALRGRDPFEAQASGQYDWDYRRYDAESWADYYGIPFSEPRRLDLDFRLLVRATAVARMLEVPPAAYAWPMCQAVYAEGRWPLDRALCLSLAEAADLPLAEFEELLDSPSSESELVEAAAEAHRRGAFGVPTFFIGDQFFWGNDRLPLVRHRLSSDAIG